jgi:dUTP pyrophosphatase
MKKVAVSIETADGELVPAYATAGASGADARAAIDEPLTIAPGGYALVPTGIRVEIPEGYEIQVRPRSGLAAKQGVTVLNTPGTVDADYRGEIKVTLINLGKEAFVVTPKMRIAQLVLAPVVQAEFIRAEALTPTGRGEGGFGHTGTK